MTRRQAGLVVLAVALLCTAVAGRAGGIRIPGTATAPPGLSRPAVGDCIASIADSISETAVVPVQVGSVPETGVTFTDCPVAHVGEVAAYRRMPEQAVADSAEDSDDQWCESVAMNYRAHAIWRTRDTAGGLWVPSTGQRFITILSTPAIDRTAPRWAVCAVVSPNMEAYLGSYLQSLAAGPAPAPFGLCRSGDETDATLSCLLPHGTQQFGTGQSGTGQFGTGTGQVTDPRTAIAACRSLVGQMTAMADLTAGGRLRVEVVGSPGSDSVVADSADADVVEPARCGLSVVGNVRLVGSLVGIGDRTLPLAG